MAADLTCEHAKACCCLRLLAQQEASPRFISIYISGRAAGCKGAQRRDSMGACGCAGAKC